MRTLVFIALLAFAGCAATYSPPEAVASQVSISVSAPKIAVLRAAKQVLVADGFQITGSDDEAGVISTAPRDLRVGPEQANCGTTMGLDYLRDVRTSTRVGMGVVVHDGHLTARATIEGAYRLGDLTQDITLTCVSRGILEQIVLEKIAVALGMPKP